MIPIVPLGDAAILVVFGDLVSPALNARSRAFARAVTATPIPGVTDVVPAYCSVGIHFDPAVLSRAELEAAVRPIAGSLPDTCGEDDWAARRLEIPVTYDGPDLAEVARLTGHAAEEVIARHAGRDYRVYFTGFAPGFAYLGELDPALFLPRRAEPRQRVPAGSVAIGGAQTGVYALDTPGGWHIIGHTSLRLFDPASAEPAYLRAGDIVRFTRT